MDPPTLQAVRECVHRLVARLTATAQLALDRGEMRATTVGMVRMRVTEFEYGESGTARTGFSLEDFDTESWEDASHSLWKAVAATEEYRSLSALHKSICSEARRLSLGPGGFLSQLCGAALPQTEETPRKIEALVEQYLLEIHGQPLSYECTAFLDGIIVSPEPLKFDSGNLCIVVRRPEPNDLETQCRSVAAPFWMYRDSVLGGTTPSAVLTIRGRTGDPESIRLAAEKALCVLRLFRLGSITILKYLTKPRGLLDPRWGAGRVSKREVRALERYSLTPADGPGLKAFWDFMWHAIPEDFYRDPEPARYTHHAVAYRRYVDALRGDRVVERRVANSVMGLEALFLKGSGEQGELTYRLRTRAGRLLGSILGEPQGISATLGDAYAVRSAFVHGDQLSDRKARSLTRRYGGSLHNLTAKTLQYLRHALLIFIVWGKGKSDLIDLLDAWLMGLEQTAIDDLIARYRELMVD